MKRKLILLGSCLITSIIIITTLFILSGSLRKQQGSFLRILPPHPALQNKTLDIKYNSYYIAGLTSNTIYLGNYTGPLHLLKMNYALTDSQHVKINIENIEKEKFWSVRVKVDSPRFYLMDGTRPRIYSGTVNDWKAYRNVHDSAYFVDAIPLGRASFAIRSLSSKSQEYELGKQMLKTTDVVLKPDILEKQVDGQFCVDGMMSYDKETARLVYVYFYRNQYIVMDSNLNLEYRGNTIDTISQAKIKVVTIESEKSSTMSAPPLLVNKHSCVSGDLLYVNSNLMARNQSHDTFDKLSVIDVYDLNKKEYKFSFYISHYTYAKVRDFRVYDNKLLVALFDNFISVFKMTPKYFQE